MRLVFKIYPKLFCCTSLIPLLLLSVLPAICQAESQNLFTSLSSEAPDLSEKQQLILAKIQNEKTSSKVEVVRLNADTLKPNVADVKILPDMALRATVKERKDKFTTLTNKILEPEYTPEDDTPRAGKRNGPGATSVLVIQNNSVTGTVNSDEGVYQIRPLGNGLHAIVTIDESKFPPEHPPMFKELEKKELPRADVNGLLKKKVDKSKTQIIDVLVAYTPKVRAATADVDGLIQLAVEETNRSYTKSKTKAKLRLVKTHGVDYLESDSLRLI